MRAVRAVNGRSYRKLSVKLSVHSWPIIGTGRELATYATIAYCLAFHRQSKLYDKLHLNFVKIKMENNINSLRNFN